MQRRERSWARRLVALAIAGGVVGAALGLLASNLAVPGYDASAFLLITPSGNSPVQTSEIQYAQAISQVVTNPSVLASAVDDTDLPSDPQQIRADPSPNAPLIELVVNAVDAATARRQAQASAEAVVTYTEERIDVLGFRAVVLAPATNGVPAGLSLPAYLVAGAAMGAVLGALIAMLGGDQRTVSPDARPQPARAEQTRHSGTETVNGGRPTTVKSP